MFHLGFVTCGFSKCACHMQGFIIFFSHPQVYQNFCRHLYHVCVFYVNSKPQFVVYYSCKRYYWITISYFFTYYILWQEFMLCREEEKDPRKCLKEGKDVTACSLNFFRKIKKTCLEEFNQYSHCLDQSSKDLNYRWYVQYWPHK